MPCVVEGLQFCEVDDVVCNYAYGALNDVEGKTVPMRSSARYACNVIFDSNGNAIKVDTGGLQKNDFFQSSLNNIKQDQSIKLIGRPFLVATHACELTGLSTETATHA